MYNKILVPLDGSDLAKTAILYAELIARQMGSEIDLITVINFNAPDAVRLESEEYLHNLSVKAAIVYSEVIEGFPGECIPDYAAQNDIDLIIMTTHGRSGISRWALGSVADKVVTSTSCPVLLIRSRHLEKGTKQKEAVKRILITLDGSRESESILPNAINLCAGLGSEAILLRVIPHMFHVVGDLFGPVKVPFSTEELAMLVMDTREYLGQIRKQIEKHHVIAKCHVRIGDEAEEIVKLANALQVDMVAMSTHGRSGIKRWMLGSVSDKVLHCGSTPLLLARASKIGGQIFDDGFDNIQSLQKQNDTQMKSTSSIKLVKH